MTSTISRRDSDTRPASSPLNPASSPAPTPAATLHANPPSEHASPPHPTRRSGTPSTQPPQKSRARDLLRKHYGLGVGLQPPIPGKAAVDPMNLGAEIRELDSERQSLVYNHHHDLIAASDTIATMKTRAESLDADLDLLKVAFSEISRISSEVAIEASETKTS
ncbi:hypothetical protein C0992_006246 [Termitomyces sp. T32_za158]|nr:hypothetical protein C0992_006246 [Termitomyces sp. T32_za158]